MPPSTRKVEAVTKLDSSDAEKYLSAWYGIARRVGWANFGVNDRPVLNKSGVHKATRAYDARGNEIQWLARSDQSMSLCLASFS